MHFHSEAFAVTDYHAAVELFFERGWTDGLAVVPPTEELVEAMAMPDIPIVVIPHLKAGETAEDFRQRAEAAFAEIAAHLQLGQLTLQAVAGR